MGKAGILSGFEWNVESDVKGMGEMKEIDRLL